jgi:Domain of unknown function (DUF1835)
MTTQADFKRRVRARMAKTGESYATARAQLLAERGERRPTSMRQALHVTNGDSAAATLLETTLVERVLAWRDALHLGPVPPVPDHELHRIRATFLADDVPADREPITRWLEERDFTLAENGEDEFVLWFEADLYDQLQLIQVLVGLGELGVDPERITLICIGEHLGIAHFGGLGELDADQLERVAAAAAMQLSQSALQLASDAWTALRSESPRDLARIATTHHPELRFLAEAFDRLSREYPSAREGLSLSERRILAAVQEGAPTAGAALARLGAREARPFLGDRFCFLIIARLANARTPLLDTEAPRVDASTKLRLTAAGRRVLDGADDHIRLNGIDRWIGGVHLVGAEARWRWNDATEAIVESSRGQPRS